MIKKTLIALLIGSTGCVNFAQNISSEQEARVELLCNRVINKTQKTGVVYTTLKNKQELRHEVAFYQDNFFNLLGLIDKDGDGDNDVLFLYSCETNSRELPEPNSDFEKFASELNGNVRYELIDLGADGTCTDGNKINIKLLNLKDKNGMGSQVQKLYNKMINEYTQFYEKND